VNVPRVVLALLCFLAALPLEASQPQFWRIEGGRDFLAGDNEGLSVDSEGLVRLAPALRVLHDPESPTVWSLTTDKRGRVYAGTGNDGQVFRIEGRQAKLLFDAPELEVHTLAIGPDGKLYVGTAPDGKVYRVDEDGHAETFFDPSEKYIWALAFDSRGRLLVATGADARLYRVDEKGQSQVVLTSPEAHFTALAVDSKDNLYVGTAPSGIVYRVDAELKASALLDSSYREVTALAVGAHDSVYAAVFDGSRDLTSGAATSAVPTPTPSPAPGTSVTTTEVVVSFAPSFTTAAANASSTRPTGKGALLRLAQGEVETLWTSVEDGAHSLLVTDDGVLVGSGDKGRLYRVRDDRTWSLEGTLPGEQVTALALGQAGKIVLATSNPGRIHERDAAPATEGTFTSVVKDAEAISSFGRVRWDAELPPGTSLDVQTRSGNTSTPDSTWSEWSGAGAAQTSSSPKARFVQLRARLKGQGQAHPVLDTLALAYLQRNLHPLVTSVEAHAPGEVFQKPLSVSGDAEILGLEPPDSPDPRAQLARAAQPAATSYSRKFYQRGLQTLSWKAEDPNNDTLVYDLHYRRVGASRFRLLRAGLTDTVYAWDTTAVPDGRYLIKVVARDSPSNPPAVAQSGDKESAAFDIDNTPPRVTAELAARTPARVLVHAHDEGGVLRRAEFSIDGQRWQEVHPLDGINDSPDESYEISPPPQASPGPHLLVVRIADLLGNVSSVQVEFP
jgi:outer membrane protein assembly factor BamB